MQIILKNGTTLEVLTVSGQGVYYQEANRDSLEIQIAKGAYSLDELDKLFTSANTEHITIINGEERYIHDHYSLRVSLKLELVELSPATPEAPAITEERVSVTLAQKTYLEQQLETLQDAVDTLVLSAL